MQIFCAANVDMPEGFIVELSQFMLLIRSTIVKEIQKRGEKYDME